MINRILWDELIKYQDEKMALVITGPRRVGKTTTLKWLLDQTKSTNKLFFDLENLADRAVFETADYNDVIKVLQARGLDPTRKVYLAIDEIQFLPSVTSVIKYLYDHYDIKFYLSGSSSYYLKNHFSESMSGRKFIFELLPLSFQEYLDFRGVKYHLPAWDPSAAPSFPSAVYAELSAEYDDYIEYGGFPEVVLADDNNVRRRLLTEIYSTYINQDALSMSDFKSTTELRKIVSLLAVRIGNRVNISELSDVTGLSRETVSNYVEFLEQTYLVRSVPVISTSESVRIRNLKKVYFVDNGIASLNAELSSGQKFENAVAAQLVRYGGLSYYDNNKQAIDFILKTADSLLVAIEAKETPTETDQKSLSFVASSKLKVDHFALVGRQKTAKFDGYTWGGSLG
ncbi:MAG: ATP-binding protein [Candidatus Nomurabacteria bacterium]|jgi:predicted AAA+ superfamily ATPase|nr:ATP-binding protein [Candidatus Nomurabacteria bacterium]